jgi:transglutaminase-like putative cysteine protease
VTALEPYLRPTEFIDSDHPDVVAYARDAVGSATDPVNRAIALYYRVRDDLRYQPYRFSLHPEDMTASSALARGEAFCVPKAVLLAAGGRAVGLPTRLGFAAVRNHLTTEKLRESLGTDMFYWHGYMEFLLDGRWIKATPAFNLTLCEKAGVKPLEFDGRNDSIFHEYDTAGRRHMEYVEDYGQYDDLPLERMTRELRAAYPHLDMNVPGDFEAEIEEERHE